MNSSLLRTIAILMAIGGVITAWMGYRLSTQPAKPVVPSVQVTYPQLVATRDLPAGEILQPGDVRLASLPKREVAALTEAEQAIGKMITTPIAKDAPVLASYFPALNPVAQTLRPDERAVAIKVNEVVGVGGFIQPGDHVDVLLYLRGERETSDISSAQVVLNNVRVLAYGDETSQPAEPRKDQSSTPSSTLKQSVSQLESIKAKQGKSAVLAVPEQQVSRLMLAENSGILRMALRGASPKDEDGQGQRHFVRLEALGRNAPETVVLANGTSPAVRHKKTATQPAQRQVIVHQGDQVEIVKVKP